MGEVEIQLIQDCNTGMFKGVAILSQPEKDATTTVWGCTREEAFAGLKTQVKEHWGIDLPDTDLDEVTYAKCDM